MLTAAKKKKFKEEGFLVFDPQIEEERLDLVRDAIDGLIPQETKAEGDSRLADLVYEYNCVKQLSLHPSILTALLEVYGETMRGFQTLNFKFGTEQPAHSDTIHFNSIPSGGMCGVWIALEDVGETQGPLVYYPGSHKLPEYTMVDAEAAPPAMEAYESCPVYEDFIADVIKRENLTPKTFKASKGQAFIWDANLLHGGSAMTDPDSTRYSQVTHYFAPRRNYYCPMYTKPGFISIKEPRWISWEQL